MLSGHQLGPEELRWRAFAQCVLLNSFGLVGASIFTFNYMKFFSLQLSFLVCSCLPLYFVIWFDASSMVGVVVVCLLSSSCSSLNAWLCPCSGTLWLAGLLAWPPPLHRSCLLSFGFCSFTDACDYKNLLPSCICIWGSQGSKTAFDHINLYLKRWEFIVIYTKNKQFNCTMKFLLCKSSLQIKIC